VKLISGFRQYLADAISPARLEPRALSPRARLRAATAALHEAAAQNRRLKYWQPTDADLNTILSSTGATLVKRARDLTTANAYAASAKEEFAAAIAGIQLSSTLEDDRRREQFLELWRDWQEECDADGQCDFNGLQDVIAGSFFDAGESFVRLRPRRPQDGLSVPLQLQVLEAEMLDWSYSVALPNGHQIKAGIEFDAIGRRAAYHFWRVHPGDRLNGSNITGLGQRTRVPAEDVLHIYEVTRPGQIRGLPKIVPGMVRLFLLDQYDDAELDRKKVAALMAFFITTPHEYDDAAPFIGEEAVADEAGAATAAVSPGSSVYLEPGEEMTPSQPADVGGNYEAFQYRNLLAASAAVGVPYSSMTGDVFKATYSSLRAEMLRYKRRARRIQNKTMIHQLCRGVLWRWLQTAVLSGALRGQPMEFYRRSRWILPKWDWVDPLKDRQAEKLALEMGTSSRDESIVEEGKDPAEVDRQRAAGRDREERLGLKSGASAEAPSAEDADEETPEKTTAQPEAA
jgi:lambda family phage portal protein